MAVSVRHGGVSGTDDAESDETCPVCKTTRYFNRDMEFLINTECYHRMCKTCVERIFRDGPNQCPYAGCHKTLRLRGFKSAFFGDLKIEREVDIRRRVANIFNKVEDDFEDLDGYNEYLEMVETLTDTLVNGKDEAKRKAEAELQQWENQHKAEIERNRRLARESDAARTKRLAAEKEAARSRRAQELQEEADEKASAARFREEMLDSLQSGESGRADEMMNKIILKRRGQQKRDEALDSAAGLRGSGLSIRGLRDKNAGKREEEGPYDPYGGVTMLPERVDLKPDALKAYTSDWVDAARNKNDYKVGGYSADEYVTRALFEAFSGLGVFVTEERAERGIATEGALQAAATGITAGRMDVDDAF